MSVTIKPPYKIFTDLDSNPLDNGYVYIGTSGLNPETNPISVYWDSAMTIAAAQPLRTIAGFIVRNGSPANVYVAGDYSVTVKTSASVLIYSTLSWTLGNDIASAISTATNKVTPVDADQFGIWDSVTGLFNHVTWANIKATLVTYLSALTTTWAISTTGNAATSTTAVNQSGGTVSATTGAFSDILSVNGGKVKFPAIQVPSTDVNTLDDYEEGSFTASFTGFTTSETCTVNYTKIGNLVTLIFNTTISGTSNSIYKTISALPSHLQTNVGTNISCGVGDNGAAISISRCDTPTGTNSFSVYSTFAGGNFTASGTTTILIGTITYLIL